MKRSAHLQRDDPFAPTSLASSAARSTARVSPRDNDSPGAVVIGRADYPSARARSQACSTLRRSSPMTRPWPPARRARLLHKAAPLLHQGKSIAKRERLRRYQGTVFAKAQPGYCLSLVTHPGDNPGRAVETVTSAGWVYSVFCSFLRGHRRSSPEARLPGTRRFSKRARASG